MLKVATPRADGLRMFMPCSDEPVLTESSIVAFCAGLNTPVVNIEVLEVGSARAGIMIAAGASGELNLLVRVCLLSSGEGVTFKFQGDPTEFRDPAAAMAAALSFCEGMGFLFEDDLLAEGAPAGRHRAIKIWRSLCGLREEAKPPAATRGPSGSTSDPSALRTGTSVERIEPIAKGPSPAPGNGNSIGRGSRVLTKFRNQPAAAGDSPATRVSAPNRTELSDSLSKPGATTLGRVKLASEHEGPDDSGFLTQLLSSF